MVVYHSSMNTGIMYTGLGFVILLTLFKKVTKVRFRECFVDSVPIKRVGYFGGVALGV